MTPILKAAVATVGLVAAITMACALLPVSDAASSPLATATPRTTGCNGTVTSTLSSGDIAICKSLAVTTTIETHCPVCPDGINVAYIQIDKNPSLVREWHSNAPRASLGVLEQLRRQDVKVGVVRYDNDNATVRLELTNKISAAGPKFDSGEGLTFNTHVARAAQLAVAMLEAGREDDAAKMLRPCEVIVIMSYGAITNVSGSWDRQRQAVTVLKRSGATVISACPYERGGSDDPACTAVDEMASSRRYYVRPPGDSGIANAMDAALDAFAVSDTDRLTTVLLDEHLPAGLDYVAGSASSPPNVTRSVTGTVLSWPLDPTQVTWPHSVSYRVQPVQAGGYQLTGSMTLRDRAKGERIVPMMPLSVTIQPWCTPPTPTPTATLVPTETAIPTATETPTAQPTARFTSTASHTPASTPTATPLPTRVPQPIFLPLTLRERCLPEQRRVDVALVLDASLSMLEPAGDAGLPGPARSKLDAARGAAVAFLDALHLDADRGDQAAVIGFNSSATLLSPLTADRPALDAALAAIAPAAQTCIVCGVDAAAAELASARHRIDHAAVLILLTDGRSNPQPASEAVARAGLAKAAGIRVYTVGLGADLDEAALREMASGPEAYRHAPSAAELAGIYRGIAVDIPCPGAAFWGGR